MYNTAKEAPTRPVDVITRKLKKKNIKIVTTNIVKILRNAGKKYVSNLKKMLTAPKKGFAKAYSKIGWILQIGA